MVHLGTESGVYREFRDGEVPERYTYSSKYQGGPSDSALQYLITCPNLPASLLTSRPRFCVSLDRLQFVSTGFCVTPIFPLPGPYVSPLLHHLPKPSTVCAIRQWLHCSSGNQVSVRFDSRRGSHFSVALCAEKVVGFPCSYFLFVLLFFEILYNNNIYILIL